RFFRGIAAASLAATTATACLGENETASAGGMAPDWPEDVVEVVDGTGERGVLADALGGELQDQAGQLDLDSMPPADMGSWSDIPSDEISPPDRPEVQAGVDPGDPDVVEGHDGFAPGGVMPDVIDTETAMDGGMWGDDVNEPK
ncbi:MAG: hypothetical protein FJ098_11945, partial [Deltaproteobacteria bacterium]|nr:hypothetical protein [Deltaproteobacteria bacterium]